MLILVSLILVALFFDFMNGRNDAANSIATIVSTRVLSPRYAVAWAAFFNFIAFLVFGLGVAATVGKAGRSSDGCALVTSSAFTLPDFTCGMTPAALENIRCT